MTEKKFTGRRWDLDLVRTRCDVDGDCWIWSNGVNSQGYPQASIEGYPQLVGRWVVNHMLAQAGKKLLSSREVAYPRCQNKLCVSPLCVQKKTRSKLLEEAYANGSRDKDLKGRRQGAIDRGWAKLTPQQVRDEIRPLHGVKPATELANQYGVHPDTIRRIWRNSKWRDVEAANSVFSWRPAA